MIFKYEELIHFYKVLLTKGRTEVFHQWKGDKVFLIRHDVDFDLKLAHDLALIEHKLGIISTYFVLTTCHSYNVLSERNRKYLKEIIAMGHEIGLHFDPTLYSKDLDRFVNSEAEVLSLACCVQIRSISLHNPSILGKYPLFKNFINAYDPTLFSDSNYISDSCFSFRGKNPYEFIDGIKDNMIQILLHPLHFSEHGWRYDDTFVKSFLSHINHIHESFLVNETYKKQIGNDFIKLLRNKIL